MTVAIRIPVIIRLCLLLVVVPALPARAQVGDIRLIRAKSSEVSIKGGGIGTDIVGLVNATVDTIRVRLDAQLPPGWTMLIPPPFVTLPPGSRSNQLLSFQAPSTVRAGAVEITLRALVPSKGTSSAISIPVRVQPQASADLDVMDAPSLVRAGTGFHVRYSVHNSGNVRSILHFSAVSSLSYVMRVEPETFTLDPGEIASVDVQVQSRKDLAAQVTHVTTLDMVMGDAEIAVARVPARTDIVPVAGILPSGNRSVIPARLTVSGFAEDGRTSGQFELDVAPGRVGPVIASALIRVPDARRLSTYANRDQYTISLNSDRFGLQLGDHTFRSSELLESGTFGFGIGTSVRAGRAVFGGHAMRSRHVFPERRQGGAFLRVKPISRTEFEVNWLSKRSFEEGDALGFSAQQLLADNTILRAELGTGWFGAGRDQAARISAEGEIGSTNFSARAEKAGPDFLGSIQGAEEGAASIRVAPDNGFRLEASTRVRRRFFDVQGGSKGEQVQGNAQLGVGFARPAGNGARLRMMVTGRRQVRDVSVQGLHRDENRIEWLGAYSRRRLSTNLTTTMGWTGDPAKSGTGRFLAGTMSTIISLRSFSIGLNSNAVFGPTFYNPVDQHRIAGGVNLTWDPQRKTTISLGIYHGRDLEDSRQGFTFGHVEVTRDITRSTEVFARTRLSGTSTGASIRDATVEFGVRIPFSIPGLQNGGGRRLSGRVVDAETGNGVSSAMVYLGDAVAVTDAEGTFDIRASSQGVAWLYVDRNSIGLDRIPLMDLPVEIGPEQETPLEIEVIRSARLSLVFNLEKEQASRGEIADQVSVSALSGMLVELRSGTERIRRTVPRSGRMDLPDLIPGTWTLVPVESTVPASLMVPTAPLQIDLTPGEAREWTITFRPRKREIKIVTPGQSLGLQKPANPANPANPEAKQANQATEDERGKATESTVDSATDPATESTADSGAGARPAADDSGIRRPLMHTVLKGETLSAIAREYFDSSLHWIRIQRMNGAIISNPDRILPGLRLKIPEAGPLSQAEIQALKEYAARH